MRPLEAILTALATFRVTKLVLDDEILSEAREAAYDQVAKIKNQMLREKLTYLLGCPWCISMYSAAGLLLIKAVAPKVYKYLTLVLASSAVTGIAYEKL